MSKVDELLTGLQGVSSSVGEALSALVAAMDRAEEAVDAFAALGGSAGRAQAVQDTVEQVHAQVQGSTSSLEEAAGAIREVAPI